MKFVLTALFALFVGGLTLQDTAYAQNKTTKKSQPTRPGNPPNWNNQHHHRPHHVRPVVTGRRVIVNNYHHNHGHRFRFGFYYQGFNHRHWSYHYWDTRYGTYLYFDPYVNQYFYWCAPHFRFYPITYVPLNTYAFPYVRTPVAPAVPVPPPPPVDQNVPVPGVPPIMPPAQN